SATEIAHALESMLAAAAEWQRLDRRADLLWSRRQLDDAHELGELTAQEQAFVAMSNRRWRRQRWRRGTALVALLLGARAIWAGVQIGASRAHDRDIAARIAAAEQLRGRADVLPIRSGRAASHSDCRSTAKRSRVSFCSAASPMAWRLAASTSRPWHRQA